jgi:hypothetical protein
MASRAAPGKPKLIDCTAESYSSLQSDMQPAQIRAEEATKKINGNTNLLIEFLLTMAPQYRRQDALFIASAFSVFAFFGPQIFSALHNPGTPHHRQSS